MNANNQPEKVLQTPRHTFHQYGQGLVEYGLILALISVSAILALAATGTSVEDVFSRIVAAFAGEAEEENPGYIVVSTLDDSGQGVGNVRVYAFDDRGRYIGKRGNTDSEGNLTFEEFADGGYNFRADYQTRQYWSESISWPDEWHAIVITGQRPFTVNVVDNGGNGIANVRVYAFNDNGRYTGLRGDTDANGQLVMNLADGRFKFRVDYQTRQYWSEVAVSPEATEATVETGQRPFTVHVVDSAGNNIPNVRVYAFNEKGRYSGVRGDTDANGNLILHLADGGWKFRADYQTRQYWSDVVIAPDVTEATVQTGQLPFTVNVVDNAGKGIAGVRVYAFNEKGRYSGIRGDSDAQGQLILDLAGGDWKFRADYQTRQYWSNVVIAPDVTEATVETGQRPFTVTVFDNVGNGINNVHVYTFNEKGQYTGIHGYADVGGQLILNLADGNLKFRADYGGSQHWSDVVNSPDTSGATIIINN